MPNVRRIHIPQEGTVNRALHFGAIDLLPAHIGESELVKWVVNFDAALIEQLEPANEDTFGPERRSAALIGRMVSGLLQSRIPFYFASVFHIGRMMVAAKESIQRVESLRQSDNLEASVSNIVALRPARTLSRRSVEWLLRDASDQASNRQHEQLKLAGQWWNRWQSEVQEIRKAFADVEDGWRNCHESRSYRRRMVTGSVRLAQATSISTLQREMKQSGVVFKNLSAQTTEASFNGVFHPLILLAFLGASDDREFWHFEMHHYWHDIIAQEQNAPLVQQLRAKYAEADPFANYGPGARPADKQLLALIRENLLWNNIQSPWLDSWRRQLNSKPHGNDWVANANISPNAGIDWVAFADSEIKELLIQKRPTPGQNWINFIQQRFEDHFVVSVTIDVREWMTSSSSQGRRYSSEELLTLFTEIANELNKTGYRLKPPPLSLIRTHLGESSANENDGGSEQASA